MGMYPSKRAQGLSISRNEASPRDAIRPVLRAITAGITMKA